MKITDYALVFMTILLSFYVVYLFKDGMNFNYLTHGEMLNSTIDNVVVAAMEEGTDIENGNIKYNPEKISDTFFNMAEFIMTGNINSINSSNCYGLERNVLAFLLIENDGYYLYEEGEWEKKVIFETEEHEEKVLIIEDVLNEKINQLPYRVYLPKNGGEINSQTVSDYSLLVLFKTDEYNYLGEKYIDCIISGAKIKNSNVES